MMWQRVYDEREKKLVLSGETTMDQLPLRLANEITLHWGGSFHRGRRSRRSRAALSYTTAPRRACTGRGAGARCGRARSRN